MGRGSLLAQRIWQSCVYPKRQKMIDEAKIWIEATLKVSVLMVHSVLLI